MVGADSGAIWTFTQGCVILVVCPPYWVIYGFPSYKETHFCLFYQDFIPFVSHVLYATRLLSSRCAYRGQRDTDKGKNAMFCDTGTYYIHSFPSNSAILTLSLSGDKHHYHIGL